MSSRINDLQPLSQQKFSINNKINNKDSFLIQNNDENIESIIQNKDKQCYNLSSQDEWQLVYYHYESPETHRKYMMRSQQVIDEYNKYKQMAIQHANNVGDYFYETDLLPKFEKTNLNYIFQPNNYPYDLKQLKHYVFWVKRGVDYNIYNTQFAEQIARQYFPQAKKIKAFENPENFKSLPNIKHYQCFIEL
ncbi:hypothetical protein PPERSA_07864 [Pseudocohnilembus persalinus]|uniref:Uncharacterized protein n=1 Tax=Pseudocohnilembus persalinus TaxID=266149 RepID=A0A0V0QCD5_PSEPJ|nr:hypothetical protein PPERSA_07864 [Pseudocohnilembus persalinus]|eukprot:KRW99787.1 hypothetical protein PPERSA_07864 [Pseudocohnilembus persalinus]